MGLDGAPGRWGAESHEDPVDWAEILVPSFRGSDRNGPPRVDIVIAVEGPLGSVRTSLWALLGKTGRPFHLVLIDGSGSRAIHRFLQEFVARHPYVTLVSDPASSRTRGGRRTRWTHRARQVARRPAIDRDVCEHAGLQASGGDIVVLLESGALVSHGWLDGLIDELEGDPTCGVVGPLTNRANGLQSFPHLTAAGGENDLPAWLTADGMALLLRTGEPPVHPRAPHLARVCRSVRRDVLDKVAELTETDDLCDRVRGVGLDLVVADDSYVVRPDRHGPAHPPADVGDDPLRDLRARVAPALDTPTTVPVAFRSARPRALTLAFVMPNMAHGGSGGLHSVYQEASGLRSLGVDAVILANESYMKYARIAYEDADELFVEFATDEQLEQLSRDRQVLVATHFKSVRSVAAVWQRRQDFLPVYYVQDYEPFFTVNVNGGAPESLEARASYDLIPGMLLFAKTHWICNAVGRVRSLPVAKVEPGIDTSLFTATHGCLLADGPVRVLAMVRPRTWRRQPFATLMLLDRLKEELGDAVEVASFGCTDEALELMMSGRPHRVEHHGIFTREEIAARLKQTDVFLDVSAFQGMGRTAFEAMCSGCVPIVPRIGGAHEYAVDDQNAVLVDSSDLRSCYRQLRSLVADRGRIGRLQEAGVKAGHRRSVLAAVLSEYAVIDHEHGRRSDLGSGQRAEQV